MSISSSHSTYSFNSMTIKIEGFSLFYVQGNSHELQIDNSLSSRVQAFFHMICLHFALSTIPLSLALSGLIVLPFCPPVTLGLWIGSIFSGIGIMFSALSTINVCIFGNIYR